MFIKSNILRSPHAFATRRGGVSVQEHTRSLNLAFGRGDEDDVVLENLAIFAKSVGFDEESVVSHPQIHSDKIITVGAQNCGEGYFVRKGVDGCDGYITRERGVTLGIKTADCVPILFEAEKNGEIIAVGATHAGWRGTVADIAGKCIERICSEFGADASGIRAAIGPCIHACCYEVSSDVYGAVSENLGGEVAKRFVVPSGKEGKYMCDLALINRELLIRRGVPAENIEIIEECTCCSPEKFFSHRYSNGQRGTMLNIIYIG